MAYGNMIESVAGRMKSKPKKKPAFLDDTSGISGGDDGNDTVDASGADETADLDTSSASVNEAPEEPIGDEGEGPELSSFDAVEDSAASELASMCGVKDVGAFKEALGQYVEACIKKQKA